MSECKHEYYLIEKKDANIEPEINKNGSFSTIIKNFKCKKCGHIKTVINP